MATIRHGHRTAFPRRARGANSFWLRTSLAALSLILVLASNVAAQVDERLAAYTGRNAKGYLAPLVGAFRSDLNSSLFHSADVPRRGFYASLEMNVMATFFGEESRTFLATTEGDFTPEESVEAPTVVGNNDAVFVDGTAGTQFAFPGGFNVDNVSFVYPQLRVGSWKGTELVGRLVLYDPGVSELGGMTVWGVGVRHSLSQYVERMRPVDLALALQWQDAELNNADSQGVLRTHMISAALQSGVSLGSMYPYAGLTLNWFELNVDYRFDEQIGLEPFRLEYPYDVELQLTLGMAYRVGGFTAYGEYNLADQDALAAGLSVTLPFNSRSAAP